MTARLEGGPDARAGEAVEDFPLEVNAFTCPACGDVHILPLGCGPTDELYKFDRIIDGVAVYVYGELDLDSTQTNERDKEPALT